MTHPVGDDRNSLQGAMAVRMRAGEWLVAVKTAEAWSDDDQKALDQWLGESSENLLAYWRLEVSWERARRLNAMRGPLRPPPVPRRSRSWLDFIRIPAAAAVLILIGIGAAGLFEESSPGTPRPESYSTSVGGHKLLKLPDGSLIDLTTSTAIRVAIGSERRVWLDKGEAYFQIVHNATHPFILDVEGHRITDLGTKFLVRRNSDQIDVMVADGKVRIESTATQPQHEMVLLTAGQAAIASVRSIEVIKKSTKEIEDELAWRRGVLVFDETPLREVAEKFNRYNTTKLVLVDEKTASLNVGGTFQTSGVESFVRVAKHILKLRVEKRGDEVLLSR